MADEPKVEITLREIYDAVVELKGMVAGHPDKLDDHETRIRALEYKVWTASSVFALVAVAVNQLITLLNK